ncbi:dynein heavy chain 2, axonemal-like [Gadus morhua]|uniref:dynein heavy chain 2, axonemal-like n=1 Tax=Gadus morhua TaxID=8049 RepID=UPI0011B82982|nr:dynein heavy chain 2, axonemal-like [Gadus morhua]
MADDVPQSPMLQGGSAGSSGRPKRSGSTKSRRAREAKAALQPEDLPGDQQDKQPGGDADVGSSVGILTEEEPEDLYAINLRRLFICRVALSDVTWDSWSEDNELALDRFIEGASIPLMVVYLDPMTGLRVENGMPSQAVDQLAYFIRSSEAPIMPETFETVVHCGTLRCGSGGGGATEGLLRLLNGVHAPLVALSTVLPKNIKNIYSANMHRFLSGLTAPGSQYRLMKGACCGSWLFFHVFNVCVGFTKVSDIPALMSGGRTGEVVAWRPLRRTLHSGVDSRCQDGPGTLCSTFPMEALQRSPEEASRGTRSLITETGE